MATVMVMPKWGMSMQEGTVGGWLKSEGDTVEKGEEIVEIESDKAVHLVEAPASGILARILVEAGVTMPITTPIAVIVDEGEEVPEDLVAPTAVAAAPTIPTPAPSAQPRLRNARNCLSREAAILAAMNVASTIAAICSGLKSPASTAGAARPAAVTRATVAEPWARRMTTAMR